MFGLQRVPGFLEELAHGGVKPEGARELATEDQLNDIRLVFMPTNRRTGPTVELERNQFFESDELKLLDRLGGLRKRHLAV